MPYYCKDGRVLNTHDFVQTQVSIEDFLIRFDEYIKDFLPHNERAKWEDDDWNYLWDHIHEYEKDGKWAFATVQDFSESYHHKHKNEHSSQYFSEVSSSLYGCMLRVPIMAASDSYISAERKLELVAFCKQQGLPPLLTIPFFGISPDLHHDTAFVQTFHEMPGGFYSWMAINFPDAERMHFLRSDGCAGQYKCGRHFRWISNHRHRVGCRGIPIQHSHFESCHGKDLSDPECGRCKFLANAHEMEHNDDNLTEMKTAKEFFDFLDARARQTIKTFEEKKGKGIYERVFIFLDSKAINHNLPEVKTLDGTTTFHEFNDTGKQGEVTTRVLS